jgi:hypothetical protein
MDYEQLHLVHAKLMAQASDAGIPVQGVSQQGFDYPDDATAAQRSAGDALFAAFDWTAEQTLAEQSLADERLSLADVREKYQARLAQIDSDLALLPDATNNQVKQILGRMLVAERVELKALRALIKG